MKILILIYLYLIYPIYSIWFISHASIIHDNLSIVGNLDGMRVYFIIWALLCELALGIGFHKCIHKSMHKKYLIPMLSVSSFMFLTSILLPYLPEEYPILSELHIMLSFVGLLSMLFIASMMIISLRMTYNIYPYDYYMILMYGCSLGIYGANYMSVNSLVEVFLGILLPIYLYHLGDRLK